MMGTFTVFYYMDFKETVVHRYDTLPVGKVAGKYTLSTQICKLSVPVLEREGSQPARERTASQFSSERCAQNMFTQLGRETCARGHLI